MPLSVSEKRERNNKRKREWRSKNKERYKEIVKKSVEKNKEKIKKRQKNYRTKNKLKIKEKYLENREENLKQKREYKLKNKAKIRVDAKKYRTENANKIKAYFEVYNEKNKEKLREKRKKHYEKNKERTLLINRIWLQNNKNLRTKQQSTYSRKRRKTDILFKLSDNMRTRLRSFLRSKGLKKNKRTFDLIGCTPLELRTHLEKQFEPGMTWNNHTNFGWHVDHIIPLSSAKTREDIEILCHYTNLQPLWWDDNLEKKADINYIKADPKFKKIIFRKLYSKENKLKQIDIDIKKILKKYDPDLEVGLTINKKPNGSFEAILLSALSN